MFMKFDQYYHKICIIAFIIFGIIIAMAFVKGLSQGPGLCEIKSQMSLEGIGA